MKFAIVVSLGLLALVSPAAAQSPVAVVEEIQGKVTGAEFMDYVVPGQVIKIGPTGSIVLSYLKTCRRETISGIGTVIGTVIGIFIPAVLQNGFIVIDVEPFWQEVAIGFILIAAVYIDQLKRRKRDRG